MIKKCYSYPSEAGNTQSLASKSLYRWLLLTFSLFLCINLGATLQLPPIPSVEDFNRLYEYNSEYAIRVSLDATFLESGAIVAYVDGQIRGAQTQADVFPPTGNKVYKLRIYSNSASGETVSLKYYDIFNDKIYDLTQTIPFVADEVPDYSNPDIFNAFCPTPVAANLLLPAGNAQNVNDRATFSWEGSAANTHYGLLLWKDGETEPTVPYYTGIKGTSTTVYNLTAASTYNWRIISYNGCDNTVSDASSFTVRELPDLVVSSITTPANVESATNFNVQYTVQNLTAGATVESSWYDRVFISQNNTYEPTDLYLGRVLNSTTLAGNGSYSNNLDVMLPAEYSGTYYIIVVCDSYNAVKETDNSNNTTAQSEALIVTQKALPNISLANITADKSTVQPGDSITVSWTVENNTGVAAIGGWSEKVSLNTQTGLKVLLNGAPKYAADLGAGGAIVRSAKFAIPTSLPFSGDTYLEVALFPNPALIEEPGGASNNTLVSASAINIGSQLFISLPASSLPENSTSSLRCRVSRSSNPATPLTVNLTSDVAGQITIPATVTIPASSYSTLFYLSTIDNDILDGTRNVQITASATAHNSAVADFAVHDNEVVALSASFSSATADEGDVLTFTVTRNLVTDQAVTVNLNATSNSQLQFERQMTIPANQPSAEIQVTVIQDDIAELNEEVFINVTSPGMTSGQAGVMVMDDDIPGIELEILTDSISEGGGPYAAWAIVRKTDAEDKHVRVKLNANVANALFFPTDITLPLGTGEKKFNLGAIDNALVDGTRKVILTAAIYLPSCNCVTTATNGGTFSDTISIIDNDGPSLSLTFNPLSMAEGRADAGQVTVTRNTPPDVPLTVNLSHNDPSELQLPATLTIPQGQLSASATISTVNDNVEDGNQQVTVTAEADGFAPGIGWVYVTDQNKPDLEPLGLTLTDDTVVTGQQIEIKCEIANHGFAQSPSGVAVEVYLSKDGLVDDKDEVLGRFEIPNPIAQGDSAEFWELVTAPQKTGVFNVLLKVNPQSSNTELVYINNQTSPVEITLIPNYSGMASVAEEQFIAAQGITISGSATSTQGEPMPNALLDVYLITNGIRQVITVTTDESGDFTTIFEPLPGTSGHYVVGACYPGQGLSEVQDEFDIMGMKRSGPRNLVWDILYNVDNTGTLTMQNLSNVDLTNVVFTPQNIPEGFELSIDTIDVLPGANTAQFNYTLVGTELTEGNDYLQVPVIVSSTEGVVHEFTLYYYCQAQAGHIKAMPASINTTMTKGVPRLYELLIYNDGAGETGEVAIDIPDFDWMNLVTPDTLTTILSGDTVAIVLQLTPGEDIPLNTPISGRIAINVANGNSLAVPYRIEAVSEETGNLVVDVVDEYTYYTDEAPHVANARVVVRHPFTGVTIAEGFTGVDGKFTVNDIPEGNYRLYVEADKHESYQNIILIDPGRTNEQSIFLSFQAITYTWDVVPTEIEDEYQIDLIMEFETNVPVPVVTIEMPKEMPALIGDETFTFPVTLTNKGLITANDVELTLPTDPEYEFITNYTTIDLLAQQAIQVPVIMKRKDSSLKSSAGAQASGGCTDYVIVVYSWVCGDNGRWQQGNALFTYTGRSCPGGGGGGGIGGGLGGGGWGGPVRGGGSGGYTSSSGTPTISTAAASCDECIEALAVNAIGCLGPYGNAFACGYSFADGISLKDAVMCGLGFTPIGCPLAILDALFTCYGSFGGGPAGGFGGLAYPLKGAQANTIPPIIKQAANDLQYVQFQIDATFNYLDQYFGVFDWRTKESIRDFADAVGTFIDSESMITPPAVLDIKNAMDGADITPAEIDAFVLRWNTTLTAWNAGVTSPTSEYPDIVDKAELNKSVADIQTVIDYADGRGYASIDEMYDDSMVTIEEQIDEKRGSVCASVTIKISQKLTMTREAFEGTLTISNGNETTPMQEIKLDLEVKDENGILSNDLFEIETKALDILTGIDGTGVLGANQKGSATILFIPEKGAAPTVPKSYSFGGSFSYLDPFTGVTVTKPLFPVILDVHPSPDLTLHYFMQRDILGDDALTPDVVEPIVPAELAVMIENNGFGTAKNVKIESSQPEIIDNEKGLAIHFELIGSNLQGQPKQLGLIDIPFGSIDPMSTKIGQWWFTSDLLGHFINYEAHVTHLDSRGNPDLSLVSGAYLHELIRSIRVYGAQDDGISDFLVNEIQDSHEVPDAIYISQGQVVLDVEEATNAVATGQPTTGTTRLYATPGHIGWNYLKINDPGKGSFTIESVTRVSDGQVIPLDNMWLTHVTLPDGKEPVYENKLHFVDNFPSMQTQEYIIAWKVDVGSAPKIVSIGGLPKAMVTEQVNTATVTFNKPMDGSTFNYEDLVLRLQGGNDLMNSSVSVTQTDAYNFEIDLSTLTTGDGYYVLTVQANEIYDQTGVSGTVGKHGSWTQFLGAPAIVEFTGLPTTLSGPPFNVLDIEFNLPVDMATVLPARFAISRNGETVEGNLTVTHVSGDTLFTLSGLADYMAQDGNFELSVDLTGIVSLAGTAGLIQQKVGWQVDTTPPAIVEVRPDASKGFDWQHYADFEVEFSEGVTNFNLDQLELWKDNVRQPLSQLHLDELNASTYLLSQFRLLTYYEGEYKLVIHAEEVTDSAGLTGTAAFEYEWTVNRDLPAPVENLRIAPDLGFSDTDGITSTKELSAIMDVTEAGNTVELYLNDNGTMTQLAVRSNVPVGELTIPFTLPTGGHMRIEAYSVNETGSPSIVSLPVFIDEAPLTAVIIGLPAGVSETHPDPVSIVFSRNIMESTLGAELFKVYHNNVAITMPGITITQVSDSLFTLSGLSLLPLANGNYSIEMDIRSLQKQTSGLKGAQTTKSTWRLQTTNRAPIANAGSDLLITQSGTYQLDGSASSDPDNDNLVYKWYAPDGVVLDDATLMNPEFTVSGATANKVYTFILSVDDGKVVRTDKVDVVVQLPVSADDKVQDTYITVFPNPSKGMVYISGEVDKAHRIQVFDMSGRSVYISGPSEETPMQLDLNHLSKGMYNILIFIDKKVISKKVVILP
ncbi:Por secretion system C-terminal sorting domain-containing protein [Saccharicrinis carchari]|uniref:Por secretion system C-terminal sorting domain-containing protein n=1 Tax=Saccharicrinis carchari TaxID=1168039 RepID=A0A521DMK5_SACCC|nr:CARDB domain-containing protein [Saccharicrinis carchari]SMO72953.1 Por secretion system C-terminal sorting domain-containing protein [Saccharicrinis carchari]